MKRFSKRTQSEKVLRDKAFKVVTDPKYDSYQRRLALIKSFLIKSLVTVVLTLNQIINSQVNFISKILEDLIDKRDKLKDKRGISIVNAFREIISKRRKPNIIWVDQGCEFYNKLFYRILKMNNIEMHSTYNK